MLVNEAEMPDSQSSARILNQRICRMSWDRGDHGHDEFNAVLPAVNDRAAGNEDPKRSEAEYFMTLERVQRVEPPIPAARINKLTGTNCRFLGTMFSLDADG
jgi:hypothetical protein